MKAVGVCTAPGMVAGRELAGNSQGKLGWYPGQAPATRGQGGSAQAGHSEGKGNARPRATDRGTWDLMVLMALAPR